MFDWLAREFGLEPGLRERMTVEDRADVFPGPNPATSA
jgi:hypothetical protein